MVARRLRLSCNMSSQPPSTNSRPFRSTHRISREVERLQGVVQSVNVLDRDLTVSTGGRTTVFDVPSDCPVFLRGERIKLRLLQPRDSVSIAFVRRNERLVAQKVEVELGCLLTLGRRL